LRLGPYDKTKQHATAIRLQGTLRKIRIESLL
jgi:hypothetical protein